jgi:hypothetical protein
MNLKALFLCLAFALGLGWAELAHAVGLTATLDRDTMSVGETAVLNLTFQDVAPASPVPISAPTNLSIQYAGSSRQITMSNGETTSSYSYQYQVTATQPGDYVIGPISASAGGQNLSAAAVRLKVVKANPGSAAPDGTPKLAFLKLIVPKNTVYLGETFPVDVQLYLAVGHENLQQPQVQGDGFVFGTIVPPKNATRTQIGNRIYLVAPFKMSAVAVKTGTLALGPAQCSLVLQIPVSRRGRDLFDDFFGPRAQPTPVNLTSDTQEITVLPLPKDQQPPSFNGAVGNFSITATASPTNVTAGDPITLRLQVAGQGNLNALPFPGGEDWQDFKLYPPTSKVEPTDQLGLAGLKSFERVIIPQSQSVKEVPAISFCYFDPDQKSYRTLVSPAIPISVRPSETAPLPVIAANAGQAQDNATPVRDIVDIKPYLGNLTSLGPPLVLRPWFLALQGVPLIAWASALIWRKRQERLENNPRLRRRLQVAQTVRQGLQDLARLAQANESEGFFACVFRLLQEQLGEKLQLPASAITEAALDERLRGHAPDELIARLHELFQMCNQARYAPQGTTQELLALVGEIESALRELRELPSLAAA